MCNGERDQFHEVVLHGETLVFSPLRPLRAVAEVESVFNFRETCPASEVRKSFTKPTMLPTSFPGPLLFTSQGAREDVKRRGPGNEVAMLHGATRAETCFAAPLHPGGGGGGTPLYELYGDVPLDRIWFFASLP